MSLLRAKNGGAGGGSDGRASDMPTMRPVTMGRPLVVMSTYEERGETLKRTSIMPDDSCYRNNSNNNGNNNNSNNNGNNKMSNKNNIGNSNGSNRMSLLNGNNNSNNNTNNHNMNGTLELPPPPPQFANPLKLSIPNGNGNGKSKTTTSTSTSPSQRTQALSPVRSPGINIGGGFRAPATPQPDYDAAATVQLRRNAPTPTASTPTTTSSAAAAAATTNGSQQQRRTLRLGTVTIGEYGEQQRGGNRETLRKMPSIGSGSGNGAQTNGILKNGNRSSASFNNNNNNNSSSNSSSNNSSSSRQQQTIKFGN